MKLAVIADVHGNYEALQTVLTDIESFRVDAIVSLGDNIGYGPEPELVVRRLRELNIPSVMGNHELALADKSYLEWFNFMAHQALLLTEKRLSPDSIEYCRKLPHSLVSHECLFVHGCPPDSILTYIIEPTTWKLTQIFKSMEQDIAFVGHTHLLELIRFDAEGVKRARLHETTVRLPAGYKYIINVGSVGQPRDGDNRAKYVIWDSEERTLEVRFVSYDIAVTADKLTDMGWPAFLARRLW